MSGFRALVEAISKGEDVDLGSSKPNASTKTLLAGLKEGITVEHATDGTGVVVSLTEEHVEVRWDNLERRLRGTGKFSLDEAAAFLTVVESYSGDPDDAEIESKHDPKKRKKKMKGEKKQRTDEAMVDIPMTMAIRDYDADDITFDLSPEDIGLVEGDSYISAPRPSSTVLTKQSEFSGGPDEPLSTEDGADSASDQGPHEEGKTPGDAPDVPNYREMDDPGEGNRRQGKRPTGKTGGGSETKSDDSDDSSDEKDNDDERPDFMKKTTNETFAWNDYDFEGILLTESYHDQDMDEALDSAYGDDMSETHDPGTELAMDRDFAKKMITAMIRQGLDDEKVDVVLDAVLACGSEKGAALTMDDAQACMDKVKEMSAGGSVDDDAEFEDKAAGDGEVAGAEGGAEHEGKTKLMADDDMDDDDDGIPDWEDDKNDLEEGSEEDREHGYKRRKGKMKDKQRQDRDDLEEGSEEDREHGYKRRKGKMKDKQRDEEKERTDESMVIGMAPVMGTDRGTSVADAGWTDEDDKEIEALMRRSGVDNYWKFKRGS